MPPYERLAPFFWPSFATAVIAKAMLGQAPHPNPRKTPPWRSSMNCVRTLKGNGEWTIEIIKRSDSAEGFEVLPRRWVVERTFGWLGRGRRLAKDWEQSLDSSTAWAFVANIRLLTRRLARYSYQM